MYFLVAFRSYSPNVCRLRATPSSGVCTKCLRPLELLPVGVRHGGEGD